MRTPPPRDDLRFSNTTGILQKKKTMWFIGVEVEPETSAPPPKKNPGSGLVFSICFFFLLLTALLEVTWLRNFYSVRDFLLLPFTRTVVISCYIFIICRN